MSHHFYFRSKRKNANFKEKGKTKLQLSFRVYFKSGNPEHPGDKFFNTTVDLQPYVQPKEKMNYISDNDGFYTVANFSHETGIAEAFIDKALGPISTVRLKIHSKSEAWIILNEV
jgi:alpha-1,3-mannosylglycoprotein beta-1,4-N-acetylglucosaminyltransferase A/B